MKKTKKIGIVKAEEIISEKVVKPNKIRKVHIDSMGCINVFPEVDKNKKQTK